MKLLENTIFKNKNKKIKDLECILENNTGYLKKVINERNNALAEIDELNELCAKLTQELNNEKTEKKKYSGKCGGLTKQVNKLLRENEDLKALYSLQKEETEAVKKEFEDFKKGKYIVKELKAERVPKRRQVMRVKDAQLTSNIIAKLKASNDAE